MAYKHTYEKHGIGFPTKTLASKGGKHIYNLLVESKALDNGSIVARKDWKEREVYSYAYSTNLKAVVRGQLENGNWLVEVTDPGNAVFVCTTPIIEDERKSANREEYFYNEIGDVARGYELAVGDLVEINAAVVSGKLADKANLVSDTISYKWKVSE